MHLRAAPANADAGALAALVVLQRKGRVLDAMTDAFAAVRRSVDDGGRALLDQLSTTTARLARIALNAADDASAGERQRSIGELEAEKERIEEELAAYSSELRAQMQPVTLEAVQAVLPERAALLEFVIFRPFDPKAETNADGVRATALRRLCRAEECRAARCGPRSRRSHRPGDRCAAAGGTRSDADRRERTCARRPRCADATLAHRLW